jgi:hypothetical protein
MVGDRRYDIVSSRDLTLAAATMESYLNGLVQPTQPDADKLAEKPKERAN